jgi:hypothetical protein
MRPLFAAAVLPLLGVLTACTGPSPWALRLHDSLQCGMTVDEVRDIAGRAVRPVRPYPWPWITHRIDGEDEYYDEIDLGFVDGKLRYVQISWAVTMSTRIDQRPRRDLCKS